MALANQVYNQQLGTYHHRTNIGLVGDVANYDCPITVDLRKRGSDRDEGSLQVGEVIS